MKLIGRKEEKEILHEFFNSNRPELLAIFGRRRIGKTYLIKNFFEEKNCFFFTTTGIQNGTLPTQISRFIKEIGSVFYKGTAIKECKNWFETFDALTAAIEKFVAKDQKVVIFFDEFPWMATHRSGLLQALDHFWNQYWSHNKCIKLIICGSSASWIINKLINNKGGLHNRITRKIQLLPFSLKETKKFLATEGIKLNHKQIMQIYMVTGGIPYYLLAINKGLSATQIIEQLAFQKNSILFKEFDNLFSSLFTDSESYIELLRIIAHNRYGIGQEDLIQQSPLSRGGRVAKKIKELEETGFIISFTPQFHKKRGIYYRVIDEYTLFYLDWIEPIRNTLQKNSLEKGYWEGKQNSAPWHHWSGYAFESICYKHISQIRKKLNINPTAIANSWRYQPRLRSNVSGAQVDLLFDRDDDAITLCEIKNTADPFIIDKQYFEKINRKISVFKQKTRTKKQIFFAIISSTSIQKTIYSEELINGIVTLDDLFI